MPENQHPTLTDRDGPSTNVATSETETDHRGGAPDTGQQNDAARRMKGAGAREQQPEPDAKLLDSVDTARAALLETEGEEAVGSFVRHRVDGPLALSLQFECLLDGYPGWLWTASLVRTEGGEPTVLETELLAGEASLLAPPWVPWSERLAEYRAQQKEAALQEQRAEEENAAGDARDGPDGGESEQDRASAHGGSASATSEEKTAHDTSDHGDTSDQDPGGVASASSENETDGEAAGTDEKSDSENAVQESAERGDDENRSRRSPRRRRRNSRRRRPRGRRRGD